jgi:NitT/TauT family transport system substrate-binding protein
MMRLTVLARIALAALLFGLAAGPVAAQAPAQQSVVLTLNWTAGGDDAPFFYAQKMGWYQQAGIALTIENGKGSVAAAATVDQGASQFGLTDLGTMMHARGAGANDVAIMSVDPSFPENFYWLKKTTAIKTAADLSGKSVGNPPADAGRVFWPAFADANRLSRTAVTFDSIQPTDKIASLQSHAVDVVTGSELERNEYVKAFGTNLGSLEWKDAGVNLYGTALIVNGGYLHAHPDIVTAFVHVTQRAYAACVTKPGPCVAATVAANPALTSDDASQAWHAAVLLLNDPSFHTNALGWFDPQRVAYNYGLYQRTVGIADGFDPASAFSDTYLDPAIKLGAVK